ncbi:hypothetical protein GCM10010971_04330 [Silvimonas amylolytica]|uniref:Sel1 repeat-containing protein n=1 Tax=Silvimonas amylolytica TaxID=449663 RepID=A0ABQ2PI14_9NEIS|nr:hypothetical protein GCM10010971_04330 [Silvimonas amylolytica]
MILQQLAEQGLARAAYNVGIAHLRGFHVERSNALAAQYLSRAAEAAYQKAFYPLARLILDDTLPQWKDMPSDLRRFKSAGWFWRAAQAGDTNALAALRQPWVPAIFNTLGRGLYR